MGAWLLDLARRTARDWTAIALVAANVIAVALALFHPPVMMSVMFLYWAECLVIGVLNAVKMWFLDDERLVELPAGFKLFVVGFFFLHYAVFLFIVFMLLYSGARQELGFRGVHHFDLGRYLQGFVLPVLFIAAGHVWSFFRNFLGEREYRGRTFEEHHFRPYKRVGAMFGIILAGGFLVAMTKMPDVALVLFVPFKLLADLHAHFRDHQSSQERGELRLL